MPKCPVCRQPLPKAISAEDLRTRLDQISARARSQERLVLETDFHKRLPGLLQAERDRVRRSAEKSIHRELLDAKRRADRAEREKDVEIRRVRKDAERTAEVRAALATKMMAKQGQ